MTDIQRHETPGNLTAYHNWLDSIGRTRATGWRWRKKGLVETVNIFGRLYISRAEIVRFEQRAQNGEFSSSPGTPRHAHNRMSA